MAKPVAELRLLMLPAGNGWRVVAPNGYSDECSHISRLPRTVSRLMARYAEWVIEVTTLDHLVMTVEYKTTVIASALAEQRKREAADG